MRDVAARMGKRAYMNRTVSILTAWAAYALLAAAPPASQPLLIEHVRVLDGTHLFENTSVIVEGGVSRSVGARAGRRARANVVDGVGKPLLPSLSDAHTHT